MEDRIPYTYLIGWSQQDKWYYGRRTARNCDPSEFWSSYFTSSKYVSNFREKYGDPDIIKIDKIFDNIKECKIYEEKILLEFDVQNNEMFLNRKNGDSKWDTTNQVTVRDESGNVFNISVNDEKYKNGSLKHVNVGIKRTDKFKKDVSERQKGNVNTKGVHIWKDKEHPKGMKNKHHTKEACEKIRQSRLGYKFSEEAIQKMKMRKQIQRTCPHCGMIGKGNAMKRWHFDNCKKVGE